MKTVNFNTPFTLLDGQVALDRVGGKPEKMNKFLGNLIVQAQSEGDACLQLTLGQKIYSSDKPITLEEAEIELIKTLVGKAKTSALVEGQILNALVEDVKKDK